MELTSSAFSQGDMIPGVYTCDGEDISPPLSWSDVPGGTNGFALIMEDPDSPGRTFSHWVYYSIPKGTDHLTERINPSDKPPQGGTQGKNDFGKTGYGGPCPQSGTHRYIFRLYALDIDLDLEWDATRQRLLEAMEGHILEQAELMGHYHR